MDKTETRICRYSSLLIALLICSPRLLSLRGNGIVAQYWHFNPGELLFQFIAILLVCCLVFHLNLKEKSYLLICRKERKYFQLITLNFLLLLIFCILTGIAQRHLFADPQPRNLYWGGTFSRYTLTGILIGIILKIVLLIRESKQKDNDNEKLKTAYLQAELELLKEQLNPHFLFNSLSSLSGIIREDPAKAQHFINHLSKIFRYTLTQSGTHLVTLDNELKMIRSYEQLLVMRFEDAFQLDIDVPDEYLNIQLPHLSLQPLLENAVKHNSAYQSKPLKITISIDGNKLSVCNNMQSISVPELSNGIGLANLNSRFRILMYNEIEIYKNEETFTVKLPLKL